MDSIFKIVFNSEFLFTAIRMMTPILYASLACLVFYKGGVDAIGTEGIMLICSLAAVLGGYFTGNYLGGLLVAMICGALLSCLFVFLTYKLQTDEVLTGIALNTFAGGITIFVLFFLTGEKGSSQSLLSPVAPTIDIPILGEVLSGHNLLTYIALILVLVIHILLFKTPIGMRIRAVGESQGAANSVGVSVLRTKYLTAAIAGALAGLGGAFMSMAYISNFTRDMVAGRGFIGMAAEGMGRGMPVGVLLSSLLFGLADSLAVKLQVMNLPSRLVQVIPYAVTIVVISVYSYIEMKRKRKKLG